MKTKFKTESDTRDLGPNSAGQSGDNQGLSNDEDESSESVNELLEEGQYFEAGILSGIEDIPPADVSEVRVREIRKTTFLQSTWTKRNHSQSSVHRSSVIAHNLVGKGGVANPLPMSRLHNDHL